MLRNTPGHFWEQQWRWQRMAWCTHSYRRVQVRGRFDAFLCTLILLPFLLPIAFAPMFVAAAIVALVPSNFGGLVAIVGVVLGIYWNVKVWRAAFRYWRWELVPLAEHFFCLQCGYDLRGSESGRCPECGFNSRSAQNPSVPSASSLD